LNIDDFKKYNYDEGEAATDTVLKKIAALFSEKCEKWRPRLQVWWDEFMILVPVMARTGAKEEMKTMAERIRAVVEDKFNGF